MGIEIDSLTTLPSLEVSQQDEILAEMLQEAAPTIDARRGVLRELLVQPAAMFATKVSLEQARMRQSNSLQAILADPTLADDETVDRLASNYRVVRSSGGQATGAVTIIMNSGRDVTIPAGAIFVAQGKSFATPSVYTGRGDIANVVSETDRPMTRQVDNTYAFQIVVVAVEASAAAQLARGVSLLPQDPPLGFVSAVAAEDFIDGVDPDTNETLLQKFAYGASTKALSGRGNMRAALRDELPTVVADSIIGMGDEEMLRDRRGLLGISLGGRVDWYMQTQPLYRTYSASVEASLVEKRSDGYGVWQVSLTRESFPGFYDVRVQPDDNLNYAGFFEVTEDVRGYDTTPFLDTDQFMPDVATALEAAFTPLQTSTIRFIDTLVLVDGLSLDDTRDYRLVVRAMPELLPLQEHFGSRSVRNAAGDVLVRAPIPCFLSLSFVVSLPPGADVPDVSAIADALAGVVGDYGFAGRLPASLLHDVIHNSLPPKSAITVTQLLGTILRADGTTLTIHSRSLLEIPSQPELLVGPRTTVFFLDPADVSISFVTANTPEI